MITVPTLFVAALLAAGADPAPVTAPDAAKAALQPFNPLVGTWKATGRPDGTRDEQQKGFWSETVACGWHFKGDDVALVVTFDKGKHFSRWELRPLPGRAGYRIAATPAAGQPELFTGLLTAGKQKEQILTAERTDAATNETRRLVVTLLHGNRFLYRLETKPAGGGSFARKYQVGATKEGEAFAAAPTGPECIVTGGKGTIAVSHAGKTYYVCCSGCRDAFKDDPEKFVKEFEAKAAGKK